MVETSLARLSKNLCGWSRGNRKNLSREKVSRDFPGGAAVKNPPANAADTGSSPGLGRSHMPRSN